MEKYIGADIIKIDDDIQRYSSPFDDTCESIRFKDDVIEIVHIYDDKYSAHCKGLARIRTEAIHCTYCLA